MSYQRLAYDDQDTAPQMTTDCDACATEMHLPRQIDVSAALDDAPSIAFADFPRDQPKPITTITDATAHLASRLHLHLD